MIFLNIIIDLDFQWLRVLKIPFNDPFSLNFRLITLVLFNKLERKFPELIRLILFLVQFIFNRAKEPVFHQILLIFGILEKL